jgi:hypothetical protein
MNLFRKEFDRLGLRNQERDLEFCLSGLSYLAQTISLAQRYAKSRSAGLVARIKSPPVTPSLTGAGIKMLAEAPLKAEGAPGRIPEAKRLPKGILTLFKNTTTECLEDKCPNSAPRWGILSSFP